MNHASLFSGIGGFDLAAEWMGWNNVLTCEIDPFCNKVLAYHFPNSIHYEDIKTTDFTIHSGTIDILSGGFPCQPFSLAGKRRGSEDDRHLWPEMLRTIREIQPTWIVGENVFGLTNWNGGVVFREVLSDLENEGYEVQPFIIPACAINAPHRRDRVWIVAHRIETGLERQDESGGKENGMREHIRGHVAGCGCQNGAAADTECNERLEGWKEPENVCKSEIEAQEKGGKSTTNISANRVRRQWEGFPTQSPLRVRDDGFSSQLDGTALLNGRKPRQPYIASAKLRNESIKAGGNAIVPQVALQIFKAIEKYSSYYLTNIQ